MSVSAVASSIQILQRDALWQMNMRSSEELEFGPYPVREGEPDCSYYLRTGLCRFGPACLYNHPTDRKLAMDTARMKEGYPERIGQPECQHYLTKGTCKFGAMCKFHHPRDKAGIAGKVDLNVLGFPLRPNEIECAYYMRNRHCKFGSVCKFHHPQPTNMAVPLRSPAVYPPIHSPTTGQLSSPLSRASLIPSPWQQSPSSYAPLRMPLGAMSVSELNKCSGQVGSVSSSENQQPIAVNNQNDGTSHQGEGVNVGFRFHSGSRPIGYYPYQGDKMFAQRPGQLECRFYMKTGDCKFGEACKFHHPKERPIPVPDCTLSLIGLPLRPGEPVCIFYSQYGICKFGPSCKFNHPLKVYAYKGAASSSSSTDAHRFLASSSGTVA